MNADHYTTIGYDHQICQDYSRSQNTNGCHVIVSDGCSSAKESDWGARLLVMALHNQLNNLSMDDDVYDSFKVAGIMAASQARGIGLPLECLRATLLYARENKDHTETGIFGDGVIIGRRRSNKELLVISEEYTTGAPYYLSYDVEKGMRDRYIHEFGNGAFEETIYDEGKIEKNLSPIVGENTAAMQFRTHSFSHECYDLVAILSDGVKSFLRPVKTDSSLTQETVPLLEILKELFNFKAYAGSFVQRRCQKAFRSVFHPNGVKNTDDFSMGVIYVGD